MTSNVVPTTVQEILKNKLSDIVGKQMDLLKLMEKMDEHVAKVGIEEKSFQFLQS